MCLKLRMDYGLQNAVILLTNKRYITLTRRLREETLSHAGRQTYSHSHVCRAHGAEEEVPVLHLRH